MHQINGYLLRSVRDMLRWNVLRFALFVGLPIMGLWLWIGYKSWDYAVAVTSMLVGWVPFSIVRADGAFFIIFFIWFVAVLLSFAALTLLVGPPILRRFQHRTYYAYTFGSILFLSSFWAMVILLKWHTIEGELQRLLTELPFATVAEGLAWLLAFFALYNGFILTLYLVITIFRRWFLEPIRKYEYPDVAMPQKRIEKSHGGRLLVDFFLFTLFSLLALPTLFIPVANVVLQLFLWAWLYRESYFLSTCRLYCEEEDYRSLREHRTYIGVTALSAALLNMLPVVNIFTPFFAQLMFFHWIMQYRREHYGVIEEAPREESTIDNMPRDVLKEKEEE